MFIKYIAKQIILLNTNQLGISQSLESSSSHQAFVALLFHGFLRRIQN